MVRLAAAVEQYSEHPTAHAILAFADSFLGSAALAGSAALGQQGSSGGGGAGQGGRGLGRCVVLDMKQQGAQQAQHAQQAEQELARFTLLGEEEEEEEAAAAAADGDAAEAGSVVSSEELERNPLLAPQDSAADAAMFVNPLPSARGKAAALLPPPPPAALPEGWKPAAATAAARLPARDVEVVVGRGISGWVPLAAPGTSSSGSGSGSSALEAPAALFALQVDANVLATTPRAGSSSAAGAGGGGGSPRKASDAGTEVQVVVGNKRMMAEHDVAVSRAVDDYMRDMEVSQPVGQPVSQPSWVVAPAGWLEARMPARRGWGRACCVGGCSHALAHGVLVHGPQVT